MSGPTLSTFWGNESSLEAQPIVPGRLYVTVDTHKLFIDVAENTRIQISSEDTRIEDIPIPISQGGTGATSSQDARANLSAADINHTHTPASIGAAASSHSHNTSTTASAGFLRALNGSTSNYMRGDGTWATPPNTTYGVATTSSNGLMASSDKTNLNNLVNGNFGDSVQIKRAAKSSTWYQGRNNAAFRVTEVPSAASYIPGISIPSNAGTWELGTYTNNYCHLSYITNSNYNSGNNTQTADFVFRTDGTISASITGSAGSVAWSNVTGKPSTFIPSAHTQAISQGGTGATSASGALSNLGAAPMGNLKRVDLWSGSVSKGGSVTVTNAFRYAVLWLVVVPGAGESEIIACEYNNRAAQRQIASNQAYILISSSSSGNNKTFTVSGGYDGCKLTKIVGAVRFQ